MNREVVFLRKQECKSKRGKFLFKEYNYNREFEGQVKMDEMTLQMSLV